MSAGPRRRSPPRACFDQRVEHPGSASPAVARGSTPRRASSSASSPPSPRGRLRRKPVLVHAGEPGRATSKTSESKPAELISSASSSSRSSGSSSPSRSIPCSKTTTASGPRFRRKSERPSSSASRRAAAARRSRRAPPAGVRAAASTSTRCSARPSSASVSTRVSADGGSASARRRWRTATSGAPRTSARSAATRRVSTTKASPEGGTRSRCAATRSGSARAASSSSAARRCAAGAGQARSTVDRPRADRVRELDGRRGHAQQVGAREPGRGERRELLSSIPASAATWRCSEPSPSTPPRVAKRRASSGSRDSRSATARVTGSGPISRDAAAFSATARRPRCERVESARTKSGLPPVAACRRPRTRARARGRTPRSTIAATADAERRGPDHERGRVGDELRQRARSRRLCSGGRSPTTTSSGRPSSRRPR